MGVFFNWGMENGLLVAFLNEVDHAANPVSDID